MTETARFVVDASIAIKWLFDDEDHVASARAILQNYQLATIDLVAPDHINHEVLNALRTGVRMDRLSRQRAEAAMRDFLALEIPVVGGTQIYVAGFEAALQFDCAFYDGLYVALAQQANCSFVHADRRLRNALRGQFELELWIEDFPTSVD